MYYVYWYIDNIFSNQYRYFVGIFSQALVSIGNQQALVPKKAMTMPKPSWHPPWKLYRVTKFLYSLRNFCVKKLFLYRVKVFDNDLRGNTSTSTYTYI